MQIKTKHNFIIYFFTGILISFFLFQTVHNRDIDQTFKDQAPRYMNVINYWLEDGLVNNYGLWPRDSEALRFNNIPTEKTEKKTFYRNDGMGYLHPSYLLQKIHYTIFNKISYQLYIYQNQFYLIISSIILSLIALKILLSHNLNIKNAYLMAFTCQLLFLTFPVNLFYYWGAYPTAISSIFILLFINLIYEVQKNPKNINSKFKIFIAFTVFFLTYTALYVAILFLLFFILTYLLFDKRFLSFKTISKIIFFPFILSLLLFFFQIFMAKANSSTELLGSSFNFRSGLDGDRSYYYSYLNLIFHRIRESVYIYQWYELMLFSVLSLLIYISINVYKAASSKNITKIEKQNIFIGIISFGAYVPYALLFTQSTVIHAKVFDPYLIIPLIIISCANLMGLIESKSSFKGFFCFIFFGIGVFLALRNLRLYSIEYPL